MDRELITFFHRLRSDIYDRISAGLGDDEPYSENILTEQVLEHLTSIGMVDNAVVCHHEGAYGRSIVKINGCALNDEEDRLDLFSTIYVDADEPCMVPRDEITKAADRAARFFEAACEGFHKNLEPAGEAYEWAARISRLSNEIERLRVAGPRNCLLKRC